MQALGKSKCYLLAALRLLATLWLSASSAFALAATAWHIPDNSAYPGGTHMRNPWFEISNNPNSPTTVTIYSGVKKFNNPYGTANQTGGILYYKGASQSTWRSVALSFDNNTGDNQFWKASFSTGGAQAIPANDVIQYYLLLTFNSGAENTYLHAPAGTGDAGGATTLVQATAAGSPFTVRNRAAWIYHGDNRVLSPPTDGNAVHQNVQFWAQVGFMGDSENPATRWVTNGAVYYTTDGSTPLPGASPGTAGNAATQVAALSYNHPQSVSSIAGHSMWWQATAPNLPVATTIRYKVGFWHPANIEQKFGDYNAVDATSSGRVFNFSIGTPAVLTVNGTGGNYAATHLFVDEVVGTSQPLTVAFSPAQVNVTTVEVFTNLNRRDLATTAYIDANGIATEEGIMPFDRNAIAAGDDSHYYKAYPMSPTSNSGEYGITLSGNRTGAYRLTARWKVSGDDNWHWFTDVAANRRDHAVVVSPADVRNINLYELNVFNMDSSGTTFATRGTLEDLHDAPNAPHQGAANHWNLDYVKNLGCNWLWLQPIHPAGQEGLASPGSPYCIRNFFEVNPLFSTRYSGSDTNLGNLTSAANRTASMQAFQAFVSAANDKGVGIMLDAPLNHSGADLELGSKGVELFAPAALPIDLVRDHESRFFSRSGNYAKRATPATSIALAPDRGDFGKWSDIREIYYGRYAALVDLNPDNNANYLSEADWFDYSLGAEELAGAGNGHFDAVTRGVWKYFSEYTLFWLAQTGVPAGSDLTTRTTKGIGGMRADFAQGIPPQAWEYIINRTRSRKWNFVFMAESVDGGVVSNRTNRHFDIQNDDIVAPLKAANNTSAYRTIFESRRTSYGQGLTLHNNMSHDEEAYSDPWQALIRYAVCSTIDGAPMVFAGQEQGITTDFGYTRYLSDGKFIANFLAYNSMTPAWDDTNYGVNQIYPVHAGIGRARLASPALRSSNRHFLDLVGGAIHPGIFGVAKFETRNASPALSDVVFAFANLDRNNLQSGTFNVAQDTDGNGVNDYGIKPGRNYNVRNIAAYTAIDSNRRNVWQWPNSRLGSSILASGIIVEVNKVPVTDAGWATSPFEGQYLKLYDVTPPPNGSAPSSSKSYSVESNGASGQVTFSWSAAVDPDGGISGYRLQVSTTPDFSNMIFDQNVGDVLTYTVTRPYGETLYARVISVNYAGIESPNPTSTSSGTLLLNPQADGDGDGQSNLAENTAGTDPLNGSDTFRITQVSRSGNSATITWSSVPGKTYQIGTASSLDAPDSFVEIPDMIPATGSSTTFTDSTATSARRFYRVKVVMSLP